MKKWIGAMGVAGMLCFGAGTVQAAEFESQPVEEIEVRTVHEKLLTQRLLDVGVSMEEIETHMPSLEDRHVEFLAEHPEVIGPGGEVTGKSVVAGLLSFFIWPGIGQYLNGCTPDKNWSHALWGLTGIFRLWSGPEALVTRMTSWKDWFPLAL